MATITTCPVTFSDLPVQSSTKAGGRFHKYRMQRSSITTSTHRSSLVTNCTNNDGNSLASASLEEMGGEKYSQGMLPDAHVLRRDNYEGTATAPTMYSTVSRSDKSYRLRNNSSSASNSRSSILHFFKQGRRRKQLTEAQLSKQVKKHCETGNWSRVRRLISNHDFTEEPEVVLETSSVVAKSSSSEGKQSIGIEPVQNRRPSYGSRNGERHSFTGRESEAAAAVIKAAAAAALLEESSSSEECSQIAESSCDENILHDVCSHRPPRDVIELLLASMRHRRGSTCSRDKKGRTPLHVAVATGASSGVIDALTMADPLPVTMGDHDKRSPLHLAVKYLAYDERYVSPAPENIPKRSFFGIKKAKGVKSNAPVLSREEAIDDTRQIVLILKNAMMTHPGQIDFKDEDSTGFAPLDYAIDGYIKDRAILRCLIRRDKSQDLCRRSTCQSQESDITPKTRNSLAVKFTRQLSDATLGSKNSLRRRRRDTASGSSVSTRESVLSLDIDVVQQIEEEEIEARRHRINRLNSRKHNKRMQDRLLDVFGIEGENDIALEQAAMKSHEQSSAEKLAAVEEKLCDSFKSHNSYSDSCHSDRSQAKQVEAETLAAQPQEIEEPVIPAKQTMTEEELYLYHLQSYLEDNMDDFGDLEYCDDLDFLYDDPDEVDSKFNNCGQSEFSNMNDDGEILIFDICVTQENDSCHFDDCSEISWT